MVTKILPDIKDVELTPLLLTPSETKTDFEILFADREALALLVQGILDNKRLAWIIVDSWLKKNNYLLVEAEPREKPQLDPAPLKNAWASWKELSKREREISLLVARGMTNAEIAHLLFVSSETVKTHVLNIRKKFNARNKADLRIEMITAGLAPFPERARDVTRGA